MIHIDRSMVGLAAATVIMAAAGGFVPDWLAFILTLALAKALVVQGVVLQMRAGLVSFGQGLFFCVGGYAVGMGGHFFGINDAPLLLLAGAVAAVALAAVLGLLMTRYRDIFFAMLSLALSMILFGVLVKSSELGSTDGFNVHPATFFGLSFSTESYKTVLYLLTVLLAGGGALVLHLVHHSGLGRMWEAIRENEIRVEYLGLSPRWLLYANYLLAAAFAALGGGLTALATGHIDPEMAFWTTSGEFVFIALLGGTAHVAAPMVAAILFAFVRTYAIEFTPHTWQMILGFVLLGIIVFLPKGLWSLVRSDKRAKA